MSHIPPPAYTIDYETGEVPIMNEYRLLPGRVSSTYPFTSGTLLETSALVCRFAPPPMSKDPSGLELHGKSGVSILDLDGQLRGKAEVAKADPISSEVAAGGGGPDEDRRSAAPSITDLGTAPGNDWFSEEDWFAEVKADLGLVFDVFRSDGFKLEAEDPQAEADKTERKIEGGHSATEGGVVAAMLGSVAEPADLDAEGGCGVRRGDGGDVAPSTTMSATLNAEGGCGMTGDDGSDRIPSIAMSATLEGEVGRGATEGALVAAGVLPVAESVCLAGEGGCSAERDQDGNLVSLVAESAYLKDPSGRMGQKRTAEGQGQGQEQEQERAGSGSKRFKTCHSISEGLVPKSILNRETQPARRDLRVRWCLQDAVVTVESDAGTPAVTLLHKARRTRSKVVGCEDRVTKKRGVKVKTMFTGLVSVLATKANVWRRQRA